MALSVIGPGFGRTGTLSLKVALEMLGIGRCYHMVEVIGNPGHAAAWGAAADGAVTDWDALLAEYSATVDWPGCHFWRELAEHYPEAKLVLTLRDPDAWYESVHETIYHVFGSQADASVETSGEAFRFHEQVALARKLVGEVAFGGRFDDRAHAIEVYQRHNDAVRSAIPADRLLVYQVSEGWQPLCQFLDRPIPDEPFPRVNTTAQFQSRLALTPS